MTDSIQDRFRGMSDQFKTWGVIRYVSSHDIRTIKEAANVFDGLVGALEAVHERLEMCAKTNVSASDAYDTFYRDIVLTALASTKGEDTT